MFATWRMTTNGLFVVSFLTIIMSSVMANQHVDLNRCYDENYFCFGSLNKIKSVGENDGGCIKGDNCNVLLFGHYVSESKVEFTLIIKWSNEFQMANTSFSISKSSTGFSRQPGYISANYRRDRQSNDWSSTIYNSRIGLTGIWRKSQITDTRMSAYYMNDMVINSNESVARFMTKSNKLYYENTPEIDIDLYNDSLYIHINHEVKGVNEAISEASGEGRLSTNYPIFIFKSKKENPTLTTTTTTQLVTRTSTTSSTSTTTTASTKLSGNFSQSSTAIPKASSKGNMGLIVGVIVGVLICIGIFGVIIYICLSRKRKKNRIASDQKNPLPKERSVMKQNFSSGNYKKKYNQTSYEEPNQSKKSTKGRNVKTIEETTVLPNEQSYSTFFKQ